MAAIFLSHQPNNPTLLKLSSFFLCLFLSFFSFTATPSPPSSATLAASSLRNKGYSLFASLLDSSTTWNATGTLFAPPDFSSSFTRFKHHNSLLSFHTLRQTLRFSDLSVSPDGKSFPTFSHRRCIFKCKNPVGDFLCISGRRNPVSDFVRVRHPDLYVDQHLVVHGVDGVLDPFSSSTCEDSSFDPTTGSTRSIGSSYLDHAVRALKRRGFAVAGTAIAMRKSELMSLPSVTLFAPTDDGLFGISQGFRYDFRYHVVPRRLRYPDLVKVAEGMEIETLVPGTSLAVKTVEGVVYVNGVRVDTVEIYRNEWIVILAVSHPLQTDSQDSEFRALVVDLIGSSMINDADSLSISQDFEAVGQIGAPMFNGADSPRSFSENDDDVMLEISDSSPVSAVSDDIRCTPSSSPVNGSGPVTALSVGLEPYCPICGSPEAVDAAPSQLLIVSEVESPISSAGPSVESHVAADF